MWPGLRLGLVTNTQDTTGELLETRPVTVTRDDVEAALSAASGEDPADPPHVFRREDRRKKAL